MNSKTVNTNYLSTIREFADKHYLNACKWVGTAATIVGALATAGGFDPINIVAFNIGAAFWLLASVRMKDAALMSVNAGLLGIFALGALVRFI
jgi:hypothetical protein